MIRHMSLGAVGLTFLRFSEAVRTAEQLARIFPKMTDEQRASVETTYPDGYPWSFNGVLIRTAEAAFLIDTGFSFRGGSTGTPTESLLEEAGVETDDVTTVILTHGHGDHVGGLLHDGEAAFPGAELVISGAEYDHWQANPDSPAAAALRRYEDQTRLIEMDELIYDDETRIQAIAAPGHTPGHIGLDVSSGGDRIRLLADTAHTLFQLNALELSPSFDFDPDRAVDTRRRLFESAAEDAVPTGLFHYPFPGVGRIRAGLSGPTWEELKV